MKLFSRNKYRFPTHHCPSRIQRGGLEQAIAELIIEARNQGLIVSNIYT